MKNLKVGKVTRKSYDSKAPTATKRVRVNSKTWIEVPVDATDQEVQDAIAKYQSQHPE